MSPDKVVLLACGSFNPPTNLHFRIFEVARDHLHRLGSVSVIAGVMSPVHDKYGKKELISARHRCEMLQLGLKTSDWIHLSDWECKQEAWTRTVEVLRYHQNQLDTAVQFYRDGHAYGTPQNERLNWLPNLDTEDIKDAILAPIRVKLLCGADLLESFATPGLWRDENIEQVVGVHGVVVIKRAGTNPEEFTYKSDLLNKHMRNITIVTDFITNDISSTKIRRAVKRGESVKYLMNEYVEQYVRSQGLYTAISLRKNSTY